MALIDIIDSFLQGREESRTLLDSLTGKTEDNIPLPSYSHSSPSFTPKDYSFFNDAGYC